MRSLVVLVLLVATTDAKPRVRTAMDVFRAARAECKKPGPALAAMVSKYWNAEWARRAIDASKATDDERAELDRLADVVLGGAERATAIAQICSGRITRHGVLENLDDNGNDLRNRYQIVLRDDACARQHGGAGCWCDTKPILERDGETWFYVGDGKLCGVPIKQTVRFRRILGLPADDGVIPLAAALEKLRAAAAK